MVSSGYGCHPDEKDFTCKFMHPHGHTENNYVTCQYGDYWWLALIMDVNPDEDFTCKGTIPFSSEIQKHICGCHNFFPLSSVQIIIIPACCLLCVL